MPILSDGIACSRLMRAAVYLSYSNLPADADASCCCSSPRWFSRCQRHKKKVSHCPIVALKRMRMRCRWNCIQVTGQSPR